MSLVSTMWVGAGGDFAAFVPPRTAVGQRAGRPWRRELAAETLRAAAAGPDGVVTLDAGGVVRVHRDIVHERGERWTLVDDTPCAVSADGALVFDGKRVRGHSYELRDGAIHGRAWREPPFEIDFFTRWTFARFLPDDALALGFESSQPWSEGGSYGEPLAGIEIVRSELGGMIAGTMRRGRGLALRAIEHESRRFRSDPVHDVAWHPRGVLAWIAGAPGDPAYVSGHVRAAPRPWIVYELLPERDSAADGTRAFEWFVPGARALCVDDTGGWLAVAADDGVTVLDLARLRAARAPGPAVAVAFSATGLAVLDPDGRRHDLAVDALDWAASEPCSA